MGEFHLPETLGGGGAFLDYDNDSYLDLYLVNSAAPSCSSAITEMALSQMLLHLLKSTIKEVMDTALPVEMSTMMVTWTFM